MTSTILIVDDYESNRYVLYKLIKQYNTNIHVVEAKNGLQAIELFKQHNQDVCLILMDIIMPGMNGYTTSSKIREISKTIPIFALSGISFDDNISECIKHEMNGSLEKPINISELYNILKIYTNS